ncbi:MAG TPA: hypothetical protein VG145_06875 [Xanthobacteraceae bacterium]|jgi:hypothetical protein|nr:hypothetical protein [Xanthobacteraceae bacterium]
MYRRRPGIVPRLRYFAGLVALSIAAPAYAQTTAPKQIESVEYKATVNEDPATKVCLLGLALRDSTTGQGVNFQLIVAQMKRDGALAGPLVTGFSVDSRSLKFTPRSSRRARLASVAFVSERYTSVALPKVAPFQDGSVATSTTDFAEGRELIAAVLRADFALSFTRANSNIVQSYKVSAPPPAEVLAEFSVCVDSLASL